MKAYELITCADVIAAIKEALYVTSVEEKRREYVVSVSVCGFPLRIHIYKKHPQDWRVTGSVSEISENGWDEMLMAVHAINEELDMRYY